MFPKQVLLELSDESVVGQPLLKGNPGKLCIDVPLPALTIRTGQPIEIDPLADLIGDLLVREGLIDAFVSAALPQSAVAWRVIDWTAGGIPEDGVAELRRRNPDLALAYPLAEAAIDLRPLEGAPGKVLVALTPMEVVEGWIQVFDQAGTTLDRLACPQSCRLAALQGELATIPPATLVVLLTVQEAGRQLLAIREGVPVFEWPLPEEAKGLVDEVKRCLAFLRREFPGDGSVRLLLEGALEDPEGFANALGLPLANTSCAPYNSLVLQGLAVPELPT